MFDLILAVKAQYTPIGHRYNQHAVVRHPAETGRLLIDADDKFGATVGADGLHLIQIHIGEPQAIGVPAGAFRKREIVEQGFQSVFC
jgi:hypothetical protein